MTPCQSVERTIEKAVEEGKLKTGKKFVRKNIE